MNEELVKWSIDARHNIQRTMVDLYHCLSSVKHPKREEAVLQLVGASFALWRAAFLSGDETPSNQSAASNAKLFLETVFTSNIIGFGDDKKSINWAGGFYINNAGYRLKHVHDLLPELTESKEYGNFLKVWPGDVFHKMSHRESWNVMYAALTSALEEYKSVSNVRE